MKTKTVNIKEISFFKVFSTKNVFILQIKIATGKEIGAVSDTVNIWC